MWQSGRNGDGVHNLGGGEELRQTFDIAMEITNREDFGCCLDSDDCWIRGPIPWRGGLAKG